MTTICELCKHGQAEVQEHPCSGCVEGSKFEPADDQQKAWMQAGIEQVWDEIADKHARHQEWARKYRGLANDTRKKIAELTKKAEEYEALAAEDEAKAKMLWAVYESREL